MIKLGNHVKLWQDDGAMCKLLDKGFLRSVGQGKIVVEDERGKFNRTYDLSVVVVEDDNGGFNDYGYGRCEKPPTSKMQKAYHKQKAHFHISVKTGRPTGNYYQERMK